MKADTIVSLTLISFLVFFAKSFIILAIPLVIFLAGLLGARIRQSLEHDGHQLPLPKNFKKMVQSKISVPRNVVFMRSGGNDCRSISFFFVHIVLIPVGFENDLNNHNKQGLLLHEFGHGCFSDYLSVIWFWLTGLIVVFVSAQFVWAFNNGEVKDLIENSGGYAFGAPLIALLVFSILDAKGMLHRRELHADCFAWQKNPKLMKHYLATQVRKNLFFKMHFDTMIKNWFFHPTYEYRLGVLTGQSRVQSRSIFLPAILSGFCPAYIALTLGGSIYSTTILVPIIASLVSIPLSIICFVQTGIILNAFFRRNSVATLVDKFVFWLGLLVGYEFFVITFSYAMNSDSFYEVTITASNGQLVILQLSSVMMIIIFGHVLFAMHAKISSWVFKKLLLGALATPIYSFSLLSIVGGIQITDGITDLGGVFFFTVASFATFTLMMILETVLQAIAAVVDLMRSKVYRSPFN